jgi:TonB family protein
MAHLGPTLRRSKRIDRPALRLGAAVVASLALNALVAWTLVARGAFDRIAGRVDPTRVALAPLGIAEWEANRTVAGQRTPPPPQDDAEGRLVELSPEQKAADAPPPKARFRSDRNTKVEKETVSRYAGVYPRLAPKPEPAQETRPAPSGGGAAQTGERGREGARGERVATARPRGDLRLPELGEGGEGGRRTRGDKGADLSVSPEAMARIAGGPSMDGVGEGLEEGDATWLQSREFRYATYMNQMRREIGQQWFPLVRKAQRERDPDGSAFFYKERTVVLGLTVDTDGNVKDLSVLQSSSVDFFDRIALSSVQAAQPFPNPPRGMFHAQDEVRIPFAFTMYPGDRRAALFWRSPNDE